jgi:hypothetical protein
LLSISKVVGITHCLVLSPGGLKNQQWFLPNFILDTLEDPFMNKSRRLQIKIGILKAPNHKESSYANGKQ